VYSPSKERDLRHRIARLEERKDKQGWGPIYRSDLADFRGRLAQYLKRLDEFGACGGRRAVFAVLVKKGMGRKGEIEEENGDDEGNEDEGSDSEDIQPPAKTHSLKEIEKQKEVQQHRNRATRSNKPWITQTSRITDYFRTSTADDAAEE
jgi:hypothetical protein